MATTIFFLRHWQMLSHNNRYDWLNESHCCYWTINCRKRATKYQVNLIITINYCNCLCTLTHTCERTCICEWATPSCVCTVGICLWMCFCCCCSCCKKHWVWEWDTDKDKNESEIVSNSIEPISLTEWTWTKCELVG